MPFSLPCSFTNWIENDRSSILSQEEVSEDAENKIKIFLKRLITSGQSSSDINQFLRTHADHTEYDEGDYKLPDSIPQEEILTRFSKAKTESPYTLYLGVVDNKLILIVDTRRKIIKECWRGVVKTVKSNIIVEFLQAVDQPMVRKGVSSTFHIKSEASEKLRKALFRNAVLEYRIPRIVGDHPGLHKHLYITGVYENSKKEMPLVKKVTLVSYKADFSLLSFLVSRGRGRGKDFSASKTIDYLRQLFSALAHLHKHKIVHGDIKPENILVFTRNGKTVLRITDYGACRSADGVPLEGSVSEGTVGYESPLVYNVPRLCTLYTNASNGKPTFATELLAKTPSSADHYSLSTAEAFFRADVFTLGLVAEMLQQRRTLNDPYTEQDNTGKIISEADEKGIASLHCGFTGDCPKSAQDIVKIINVDQALAKQDLTESTSQTCWYLIPAAVDLLCVYLIVDMSKEISFMGEWLNEFFSHVVLGYAVLAIIAFVCLSFTVINCCSPSLPCEGEGAGKRSQENEHPQGDDEAPVLALHVSP